MTLKNWIWKLIVPLIAFFGAAIITAEVYIRFKIEPQVQDIHQSQEEHLEAFLEDQEILGKVSIFNNPGRKKDAGPYLNDKIEWEFVLDVHEKYGSQLDTKNMIRPPEDTIENLREWGSQNFLKHYSEVDFSKINLGWMKDILQFDHWNFFESSPIEKMYADVSSKTVTMDSFIFTHPVPKMAHFLKFVQLRWMLAAKDNKLLPALKETRHLARLLYSTQTLIGSLMSTAVIGYEFSAYQYFKEKAYPIPSEWIPISLEIKNRAKRAIFAYAGYSSVITKPEVQRKVFFDPKNTFSLCAGLGEGIFGQILIRAIIEPHMVFERDFRDDFARLDEVIKHHSDRCHLKYLRSIWNNIAIYRKELIYSWDSNLASIGGKQYPTWLYVLPYSRKAFGYILIPLGMTIWFSKYELPLQTTFQEDM